MSEKLCAKDFLVDGDAEDIISWRRQLHRHPEMKFDLENTVALVERELDKMGIPYTENFGKGSVVATINGDFDGPVIALRADMDALPIEEKTGLPYSSEVSGVMHACGHDGHTAMLLGAAKLLKRAEDKLKCKVRLIFQPCEEGPESGADLLIENGVLEGVKHIAALHVANDLPVGTIGIQERESMAACHSYEIEFFGQSAHATAPASGCDALAMAVKAYNDIYLLAARTVDPFEQYVLSIGSINAGITHNIIPGYAKMMACVRYYNTEFDRKLEAGIKKICKNAAEELGGTAKVSDPMKGHPLINDEKLVPILKTAAAKVVGSENVKVIKPAMTSEDFAHYTSLISGVFFRVGTGNPEKGCVGMLHNCDIVLDEDAFVLGSETLAQFVFEMAE